MEQYILEEIRNNKMLSEDEDRLFALSLVPCLKRLSPRKKAEAKISIQQTLQHIEFSYNSNLQWQPHQQQHQYQNFGIGL